MPYTVTVRCVDAGQVLNTVDCWDLPLALRVKLRAFRSYHFNDLGGQVVVPATMDFDHWDDVDRLRHGNRGPFVPVRVSIHKDEGWPHDEFDCDEPLMPHWRRR
ncbi:MAG: hypothetical protein R6V28_07835 [Nitriliruptoraceae bacterium]